MNNIKKISDRLLFTSILFLPTLIVSSLVLLIIENFDLLKEETFSLEELINIVVMKVSMIAIISIVIILVALLILRIRYKFKINIFKQNLLNLNLMIEGDKKEYIIINLCIQYIKRIVIISVLIIAVFLLIPLVKNVFLP